MDKNKHGRWMMTLAISLSIVFGVIQQNHTLSELTPTDTSLDMGSYDITIAGGSLGVGTTAPDSKLHVVGGVCLQSVYGSCTASGGEIKAVEIYSGGSKVLDANTDFGGNVSGKYNALILVSDSVSATEIAADAVGASELAADSVGSGEIASDAVGSSELAADSVGSSEISANQITGSELSNSSTFSMLGLNVGSGNLFVDSSLNRVGIGKTDPSQALDVVGEIYSTGTIYEGGSTLSSKYQEAITTSCSGTEFIKQIWDNGTVACGSETYLAADDLIDDIDEWDAQCSSCVQGEDIAADTLDFGDFSSSLDLDETTYINIGTSENFIMNMDSTGDIHIRDGVTDMAVFHDTGTVDLGNNDELYITGNILIGTTSAIQELTINGNLRVTGGGNDSPDITTDGSDNYIILEGGSSSGTGGYIQLTGNTYYTQPGSIIFRTDPSYGSPKHLFREVYYTTQWWIGGRAAITADGKVGFGTTNPSYNLDVTENAYVSGGIKYGTNTGSTNCDSNNLHAVKMVKSCVATPGKAWFVVYMCYRESGGGYWWYPMYYSWTFDDYDC